MKMTPGPWAIDYGGTIGHIKTLNPTNGKGTPTVCIYDVGIVHGYPAIESEEERQANAQAISALPELIEEHEQWAFTFGEAIVLALQGDTLKLEQLTTEMPIDYIDGKPCLKSIALKKTKGE